MYTEKRLIDANALYKKATAAWDDTLCDVCYSEIINLIDEAATVAAVEVVRCKDCRWARPQDHREPVCTPAEALICQCFMHHHIPAPWGARMAVNPDGFCSYGERRNDG